MEPKYMACLILALVFIIVIMFYIRISTEGFVNKNEKASAIFTWMANNKNPKYNDYKSKFDGSSDIVEFDNVLKLKQSNNFTVGSIETVI
jgi:hypothetical protein